jgi:hypothetical protein
MTKKRKRSFSHPSREPETKELHMDLATRLRTRYLDRLLSTARGRAFVLNTMADAESSDEGAIFELLEQRVDDPELQRMIRKHADDELRHAEMFRACVERNGGTPGPVPDELRLIDRLDRALGDFFDRGIDSDRGVMEAYLLLQVIEERAITQFAIMEPIFRIYDPLSADVLVAIGADEERHLKYCHAISKRYAPDEATREATLARFRDIEARAFAANGSANMVHCLDQGITAIGPLEAGLWRGLARLSERRGATQPTPFARPQPAALAA